MSSIQSLVQLAWNAAYEKGAENPIALDVSAPLPLVDAFLIVSGRSERNVQAIADAVEERMSENRIRTIRREGRAEGRWVLLDFGDLVVHVFLEQERGFYDLERLWRDCPVIKLSEDGTPAGVVV